MQYCIYLRKSRKDIEAETHGEGETLARHEKALLNLAKTHNLNITEVYKEIVSGETISSRPVMQHLLNEVEQDIWNGVLVMEVERLARGDTIDQGIVAQAFKISNTKIITPAKIYDPSNEFDEEYFEFGLFMSRREYKAINRRLQRGRIASVKEGKWLGAIAPYGYKKIKLKSEKGYSLQIVKEQADIVKTIFELFTIGENQPDGNYKRLGVSSIVRRLNNWKIRTIKSDVWTPSTVRTILTNPVYVGKIRWNSRPRVKKIIDGEVKYSRPRADEKDWILVEGLHEAIIDKETWNLTQFYIKTNKDNPIPHEKTIKNPLSGLIVCGVCGRKMVRKPYNNSYPDTIICPSTACNNVSSLLQYVEDKLLKSLEKWFHEYEIKWTYNDIKKSHVSQNNFKKRAVKNIDIELNSLKKQSNNIHDLLEKGVYSIDKFLDRLNIINTKIEGLKKTKNLLIKELENNNQIKNNPQYITPKAENINIISLYHNTNSIKFKNELLKSIIDKVIYTKKTNGRWNNKPDNFEIIIYPKIPNKYN